MELPQRFGPLGHEVTRGLIAAVRDTARTEIMPHFRNLSADMIDTKSGPHDLVTLSDQRAEEQLSRAAQALLPDALIIGEEAVAANSLLLHDLAHATEAVIIDPIDGTGNFVSGLAVFGVILAVMQGGRTVFGLLYDPVMDDWIMAAEGAGAWLGRPGQAPRRLSPPPPVTTDDARGYISLSIFSPDEQRRMMADYPRYGRIRDLYCSCHEYRMLALGSADFLYTSLSKPWDHAAGSLIIQELGGQTLAGDSEGYDPAHPRVPLFVRANRQSDISPPGAAN